jgi:hypothetical protein
MLVTDSSIFSISGLHQGASKAAIDVLETLNNELNASWQAAVERIEELMGD